MRIGRTSLSLHFHFFFQGSDWRQSTRGQYDTPGALCEQLFHSVTRTQAPVAEDSTFDVVRFDVGLEKRAQCEPVTMATDLGKSNTLLCSNGKSS